MRKHLYFLFVLFIAGTNALRASDWVLNDSKSDAWHKTDHIYLEVFIADLDGKNTYWKEGTVTASNGSKTIDLLKLKYVNEGDDESSTAEVKAQLLMSNAKAYFTNSSGSDEISTSEKSYWLYKWGSDKHYMTVKVNLYYNAEMLGGSKWHIYSTFNHSDGDSYFRTVTYELYTDPTLGLSDFDWKAYKVERTGIEQMTFTVPKLPDDISSSLKDIRARKCTYDVLYTFYKQEGTTVTVSKQYEAGNAEKTENCTFPDGVGNPTRIDCKVTATHGIKNSNIWYNQRTGEQKHENAFKVVPLPAGITTDYRQFDHQAAMTWTSPKDTEKYLAVTPYIYRIETDANGNAKSGKSWDKRGKLDSTDGGAMSFTDDDADIGTYYKYMVVNVPTDWINNGIAESSLTNPTDALLAKLGYTYSDVMNTAPMVSIYNLRQDTTQKNWVRLTWQYSRIPTKDKTVNFTVLRRTSENDAWSTLGSKEGDTNPSAGYQLDVSDLKLPNSKVRYQYKIRLNLSGYSFESDPVTAGILQGSSLQSFTATKGVHDGSVLLSWSARQAGTDQCNYRISRHYVNSSDEFKEIYSENGTSANYTYTDNTVKPGYYYEYRIELYEANVLQSTMYAVGFCQSRGTVSGRVTYGTGTAVPDVRLWLRPNDMGSDNTVKNYSQYVNGASEGIAWKADATELEKVFGSDKDFTVQFFVRPDSSLQEGAVLGSIPGIGLLTIGESTQEGYKLSSISRSYVPPVDKPAIIDLSTLTDGYTAQDGDVLTGELKGNYKISIADGAEVQLKDVAIYGIHSGSCWWAGISCLGNATLVLVGNNTVRGFHNYYPAIHVTKNKTLKIVGKGSLTAYSNGSSAGIGAGRSEYNADRSGGNIVIEGGTINATGGSYSAGIGGTYGSSCGNITIAKTVEKVTAQKNAIYISAPNCIGSGPGSSCGVVTIGDTVYYDGSKYLNGGDTKITQNAYTYPGNNTWTSTAEMDEKFSPHTIPGYYIYEQPSSTGIILPTGKYSLLTVSKTGSQLTIQIDDSEAVTFTCPKQNYIEPFSLGGAAGVTADQAFKGNFAEVRVWNYVLTDAEKRNVYDRRLNGRESGLALYWPLDEGLDRYAFDASYASDQPNGRHATIGNNIAPSSIVPAEAQLSRYGVTDSKGEYLIHGIPFLGTGSSYSLVPELGIHKFNPNTRTLFISPSTLVANDINFTDESSFSMTGKIRYAGTNIPAEGIQLYIDGVAASANGKPIQTDADGNYAISVPIGDHYVEAKLLGHCLVDSGRYPIEGTHKFIDKVKHDFSDSTLVNFVGRVSGAKYNDTIPVGFGQSKNNIGAATITLRLTNESFSFNCKDDHVTPAETDRYFHSDTASIRSHAWTGSGSAANTKAIYIVTDSATGEFSVCLPPLKYVMRGLEVKKNSGVQFTSLTEVDLTNPKMERQDSIRRVTENGDTIMTYYTYNTKKVFTHYAEPQVDVVEKNHSAGAFGLDSLIMAIDEVTNDTICGIYTIDNKDSVHYMFGYPVYQMSDAVEYEVHAYETYINYDGKEPVVDIVDMNEQELTIGNEMSADQDVIYDAPADSTQYTPGSLYKMKNHRLTLDKNGRARLPWTVGLPNIVKPFTRQFNITLKRDNRTYEPYRMDAIVLGNLTTGNNFVTQGPDNVQFILRDPYGAQSKTVLKKGTATTTTRYKTTQINGEHSLMVDVLLGSNITTATGIGVAVVNSSNASTDLGIGVKSSWSTTHKQDSVFQTTTVESISTSDKAAYIGAMGDVYVGTSTNILIGTCRKVHPKKNVTSGKYEIVLEDALATGTEVKTAFAYSQYELENVMIPKWKDQRGQYLTQVATEAEARSYVNNGTKPKCVTWLSSTDDNYGKPGTYIYYKPVDDAENSERDSVEWCNEQIEKWENQIRKNEEEKVMTMASADAKMQNYSIDGGSSRTFTYRSDTTSLDQEQTTYNISGVVGWKQGWQIKSFAFIGVQTNVQTSVGTGETTGTGDDTSNYTEWEYVLNDGNRDADLSINVYDSPTGNHSKIFSLFGGQTYNPYEPADSTHYYTNDRGEYVPLGNGSVQMEQPYISISKTNEIANKHTTITDIPSGSTANAIIYCANMGNTNQGKNFSYDLGIEERTNPYGLEILMDGTPITGRSVYLDQGQTTQKVITIRQTDESILDYDSIEIKFMSQYQPAVIYDIALLSAHFVPSSSPVELTIANPVINTDPTTGNGELSMQLSGINRQFKNLKNVGVQYRFEGSTQWTTLHTWVTNKADSLDKSYNLLPKTGNIPLTENMSDNIAYPEGNYEFRAFTTTPYDKDDVHVYSDVIRVIKDMTLPRPLFTPAPANGILGIGDQLAVEFNEDIVPGYVSDKNVIITAKLNGRKIDHDVSLHLMPFVPDAKTVNPVFLSGNFSMDFWMKIMMAGTVIHQGTSTSGFSLEFDNEYHAIIRIAGKSFTSTATVPLNEWTYFALNYNAQTMHFSLMAQYDKTTLMLFDEEPVGEIPEIAYSEDNHIYLGPIWADIHDLALYNIYRDVKIASGDKYVSKDAYTYGLTNYWPFNEGHGTLAADTRHTHDFIVDNNWTIAGSNHSLSLNDRKGARAGISLLGTNAGDSYAIELWYNSDIDNGEVVFQTGSTEYNTLCLRYDTAKNLILDYGTKSCTVAAVTDFPDQQRTWRHFALNVVRGQAASFYLNGQRTAVLPEADVPNLIGDSIRFGYKAIGHMDEVRVWKATLSEERLLSNMYNTIDTADLYSKGLILYYPFDKDTVINGEDTKGFTLENMAPASPSGSMVTQTPYPAEVSDAPIKQAPVETKLDAVPVASERKVVINLSEADVSARELEGTTINITLAEIHDLNGNISSPIKWTAYVQQNTLMWTKDSVNIFKQYGDDYTFDVNIENKGGQTEYYTIANLPAWLSLVDSENADDVQPLKTKTLRFAVNPLVPVGNYDVNIGVQGNKGILEPLRIVMKVSGNTPDWTVDPTLYDHSMTIIGQVYLGGILMENTESMVAAFIGNECRGVASPKKVRGAAYVSLNVHGQDTQKKDGGKELSFRIWDATKGIAYTDARLLSVGDYGKVCEDPKVEIKYTRNGEPDNSMQENVYLRIMDPDGNLYESGFDNTITAPVGYTLQIIGLFNTSDRYAFTLEQNLTIVCDLQTLDGETVKFTANIESSSDLCHAPSAIVFHDGVLAGDYDNPVIWTMSDKVEQLIPVHENWNWITLGVEPESSYCDILFADYSGWGILLKDTARYIQSNGAEWKGGNNPLVPEVNRMYKMKITRTPATETAVLNTQMSISGKRPAADSMRVQIEKNWNWLPYTPLTTMTVGEALAGINPQKGDIIKSQTAVSIYGYNGWEGVLDALEPGHGYLYFSTDTTKKSFTYPANSYTTNNVPGYLGAPSVSVSCLSGEAGLTYFTPVDKHNYPSNMTMTIRLMDGATIVDTCEIAAFVGDECRGAVRADSEGLYYLVIAGDGADQAMAIRTVLDGEVVTIDNTLTFTSDDHIGTPWEPYIIRLNLTDGIEDVHGNDVQDTRVRKFFRNGILYIERNGKTYTATGHEVK